MFFGGPLVLTFIHDLWARRGCDWRLRWASHIMSNSALLCYPTQDSQLFFVVSLHRVGAARFVIVVGLDCLVIPKNTIYNVLPGYIPVAIKSVFGGYSTSAALAPSRGARVRLTYLFQNRLVIDYAFSPLPLLYTHISPPSCRP